jgi:23S rRNA pseudouridine1911/1915/1917 synthase
MRIMGSDSKIKIIYEDNHLLVVEKPVNMLTQGDQTGDDDLLTVLKEDIKVRYNKPGNVYLGLVHRLDRPVGGAMVFAKTSKAASRLSEQIRTREFEKAYMAVIHGVPERLSDTLVHYLVKDEKTNTVRVVPGPESADHPGLPHPSRPSYSAGRPEAAKKAILEYTVKDTHEGYSLVYIKLHTGRPHQIRVQFAVIGHPLYGDQKYGTSVNKPGMQLALWSAEVGFIHPVLREHVSFRSAPPSVYPWNLFKDQCFK